MTSPILSDRLIKARITHALGESYTKGGVGEMLLRAFQIEAGTTPAFSCIDNRRMWLSDILRDAANGHLGDVTLSLTPSDLFRIHNYRDDLRHGR